MNNSQPIILILVVVDNGLVLMKKINQIATIKS